MGLDNIYLFELAAVGETFSGHGRYVGATDYDGYSCVSLGMCILRCSASVHLPWLVAVASNCMDDSRLLL